MGDGAKVTVIADGVIVGIEYEVDPFGDISYLEWDNERPRQENLDNERDLSRYGWGWQMLYIDATLYCNGEEIDTESIGNVPSNDKITIKQYEDEFIGDFRREWKELLKDYLVNEAAKLESLRAIMRPKDPYFTNEDAW